MRKTVLLLTLLLLTTGAFAQADEPIDIEALDAEIKQAEQERAAAAAANRAAQQTKQNEAARQGEARRAGEAARQAELARQRAPAAPVVAAPARGTLIVQSNADCALSIDGSAQGKLKAGQPKTIQVVPGEQLILCTSIADPEQSSEQIKAVAAGSKQVVKLELAAQLKPKVDTTTPGTVFRDQLKDGSTAPDMVVIPAGSFMMGSPDSEADRSDDEGPQHRVSVPAFAMGKTEVTVAQFRKFVNATGYRTDAEQDTAVPGQEGTTSGCFSFKDGKFGWQAGSSWRAPGFAQGDNHPAVCLSFNDAQAYVEWLAGETGKPYRLPSEAQHEYAVRAGTQARFAWGNDPDSACAYANVSDQSAKTLLTNTVNCTDGYTYTSPVGSLQANAFGLEDVVGNAWEWTADCSNDNYSGAPSDGSAWAAGDCSRRVLRGAGWSNGPVNLRAAFRSWLARANRRSYTGLRLIQDL